MKALLFIVIGLSIYSAQAQAATCPATAQQQPQGAYSCTCTSSINLSAPVWGTGTYTNDSNLCKAAVHAGVIGFQGGPISYNVVGGQSSYTGSIKNDISTYSFGAWSGSFSFAKITINVRPPEYSNTSGSAVQTLGQNVYATSSGGFSQVIPDKTEAQLLAEARANGVAACKAGFAAKGLQFRSVEYGPYHISNYNLPLGANGSLPVMGIRAEVQCLSY